MNEKLKQKLLLKLAFHEGLSLGQAYYHEKGLDNRVLRGLDKRRINRRLLEKTFLNISFIYLILQNNIFELAKLSSDKKIAFIQKNFKDLDNKIWNIAIDRLCKLSKELNIEFKKLNLSIKEKKTNIGPIITE